MQITNYSQNTFKSFNSQRRALEIRANDITKSKSSKSKAAIGAASFVGAVVPLVIYNIKKGQGAELKDVFKKQESKLSEKIKASTEILEIKNIKQIGISITGSILAGLGAGYMTDKSPVDRREKKKEAIYGFLNCMIPMGVIAAAEHVIEKNNIKTGVIGKLGLATAGIASGMFVSNKIANKLNKAIFKENDNFTERKIKPSDCLVHLDDIMGVAVLSKIPFANHIGKILPLIYTHVGYEAGAKKAK